MDSSDSLEFLKTTSALALTAVACYALFSFTMSIKHHGKRVSYLCEEIEALANVVDECYGILEDVNAQAGKPPPRYIQEYMVATFQYGQEIFRRIDLLSHGHEVSSTPDSPRREQGEPTLTIPSGQRELLQKPSGLRWVWKAVLVVEEIASKTASFRDRVMLLRELCSDLRIRGEVSAISAAMARLTDMSIIGNESIARAEHHTSAIAELQRSVESLQERLSRMQHIDVFEDESVRHSEDEGARHGQPAHQDGGKTPEDTATGQGSSLGVVQRRSTTIQPRTRDFRRGFAALEESNYTLEASVLVEDITQQDPSRRFRRVVADAVVAPSSSPSVSVAIYHPCLVKLDTGSDADLASLEYLMEAGLRREALIPIPKIEQEDVEGLNGAIYTPEYRLDLTWYIRGQSRSNRMRFYVVEKAPFDLLLSSKRFAVAASRQISLPITRIRKSRAQIAAEIEEQAKLLEEERRQEDETFQAELARQRPTGRVSTTHTVHTPHATADPSDIELGVLPTPAQAPVNSSSTVSPAGAVSSGVRRLSAAVGGIRR